MSWIINLPLWVKGRIAIWMIFVPSIIMILGDIPDPFDYYMLTLVFSGCLLWIDCAYMAIFGEAS